MVGDVDDVVTIEANGAAGGPTTIGVVSSTLLELRFARDRAERAETRVADLERLAAWTNDRVAEYERRIATLEANTRVSSLQLRQARRDNWWMLALAALAIAAILALAWATGGGR